MKILCSRHTLEKVSLIIFLIALLFIQTTQAQSKLNTGNPASNNSTSATSPALDKEVVKRELMSLFFTKWDSDKWGKIKKLLEGSPSLINTRIGFSSWLHRACQESDLDAAEWLLSHGVDVNIKDDAGATPLFYVQDVKTARWLLEHGADVDVTDVAGQSPLYRILAHPLWLHPDRGAAQRLESEKIALLLMACGSDIEQEDNDGNDFLHVLATGEHNQWLEYYLQKGANPNTKDRFGRGIWFAPVMAKQNDRLDWLEKYGLKYDPKDETLVKAVLKSANKYVMQKLQKKGLNLNKEDSKTGFTLLETSIMNNDTNAFNMLLECGARGAKANKGYNSKLLIRPALKKIEFTKHLIAQGYGVNDKDAFGCKPLFSAILVGPKEVVELLLNKGADKNEMYAVDSAAFGWMDESNNRYVRLKSVTPLIMAVYGGRKDALETLLAHGADVNLRTDEGYTALVVAEKTHNKELADLLRQKGGVE